MDVSTLMHNLKEEVTCSVCKQLYADPKQLPCLHMFCLQCLNSVARTSTRNGRIKCPLCQAEIAVPDCGTMESLPDCFYLKNILDILAIKTSNTSKVVCGNCEKKSEKTSYCFHCSAFWCNVCLIGHNIIRANKEHRVLALKDFKDKDFEDVLKRPAFCPKELHDKEVLKFFCKVCNVPVCQSCVIVDHVGHIVEHLEKTAQAVKNNVMAELESAKKSVQSYTCAVQDLEEKLKTVENRTQATTEKIRLTTQTIIFKLQGFEQKLTTEVESQRKEALERLTESKAILQAQLTKHKKTISQVEHLIDRSTATGLVWTQTHMNELFHGLKDELPCRSEGEENCNLNFIPNQSFLQSIDSLGSSTLGSLSLDSTTASKHSVTGKEQSYRLSGGAFYSDPKFHNPWGVAVNASNDIFVTDMNNNQVKVFSENGKLVRSFGGSLLNTPSGICIDDLGRIYVTDRRNRRILLFNSKGELLKKVVEGNKQGCQLIEPRGIALDPEGNIIVCNSGNRSVQLFSLEGELLLTFDGKACGLDVPFGCLYCDNKIYVSDFASHLIKVFNQKGNFLFEFGGQGSGDGKFQKPTGLALDKAGNLLICDDYNHRVQVFTKDGTFITKFGSHGQELGQLDLPSGVAVLSDGRIVVAEFQNNRIQFFNQILRAAKK